VIILAPGSFQSLLRPASGRYAAEKRMLASKKTRSTKVPLEKSLGFVVWDGGGVKPHLLANLLFGTGVILSIHGV